MFWKIKSQNVSSNFGFLGFTTSNALLPPLPPHIGIFTVQCSPVNWLFQTFELHRQKCSIMASTGSALLGSIGLTFKQGFDAIQRNGGGSPAKGSAHKSGSQWREGIDLKGERVPFWGLYIFPALWNQPPPKWRDFWIHRQTANLNLFRAIGEKAFPWRMLLVICIEASPAELFSKWKVCR